MLQLFKKWFNDESGQAMSEYGLLIAIIGVFLVGALITFRGKLSDAFEKAGDALGK
jgi:pilus assembly protein Flp/PilA